MRYASLRQGLVGAWCPSLGPSGNILIDRSGYGNHGTLTNMDAATDWVGGRYGWALDFDGIDDVVNCGLLGGRTFGNPFAWACWVRDLSVPNPDAAIMSKISPPYAGVMMYLSSGKLVAYWAAGSRATSAATVTGSANWIHVGIEWTGSLARVYFNGRIDAESATTTPPAASSDSLRIGDYPFFSSRAARFQFDDARVYERALSATEWSLLAAEPGIGLKPERTSVFFGADSFSAAWLARQSSIIGGGVA